MNGDSYLRYLLTDNISLRRYYKDKKSATLQDIWRSMLLKARELHYSVPDHYYRLGTEYSFESINELSELFTIGLPRLADDYLEMKDDIIYVRGERMNDWQLLLPLFPPLLLTTVKIWKQCGSFTVDSCVEFANKYLRPSVLNTALPSAFLPEMMTMKDENHGFCDLHIHLNGAIESDFVWHDFLRHPEIVYDKIRTSYNNSKVKEQLEQLTYIESPVEFLDLFRIASRVREWLFFKVVFGKNIFDASSFENLLEKLNIIEESYNEHPYKFYFCDNTSPLILESTLYISILTYLSTHPKDDAVAGAFHYYLLILGLCNKLMVQQTDAFGFEQFQKYTSNNFREFSERTYGHRFLQLAGNDLSNIRHIEGRFSPKKSTEDNVNIIRKIADGFEFLNRKQIEKGIRPSSISLVAHFIKRSDNGRENIRHYDLRKDIERRTDALIALKNSKGYYAQMVKGVDAAASEFDTPPEVFAPSFLRLRNSGIKHITYHAGEDFFHILTGLRSIYEAIEFLGLRTGDRIGHATASGIEVALWKSNIGDKILMRMGDYMDDLVFAYHLIVEAKDKMLEHLLPLIALQVEKYSSLIYVDSYSIYEMIEAWKMRAKDPNSLIMDNESISRIENIYKFYHSKDGRKKGNAIISVDTYDIFGEEELIHLQKLLLRVMHFKQIVIETLPTSNVIIGHHHSFSTYHLYNWYKWSQEGENIPAIVIGTDDAGIFATNIYNEYCHIYCQLVFDKGLSPYEAMAYIESLEHNAKVYAFK